jgi:hypothetical protein
MSVTDLTQENPQVIKVVLELSTETSRRQLIWSGLTELFNSLLKGVQNE